MAMLKVNYDSGRDYIAMFEPMLLDTVAHLGESDFGVDEVRTAMAGRHDLELPTNTVRTLVGRLQKRGYIKREGGRYFRTDKEIDEADLKAERQRVEGRQERLARELCVAAAERGIELASADQALAMILEFIEGHHVALSLELPPSEHPDGTLQATETGARAREVVTASFLQRTIREAGELADVIQEMLEGLVLRNVVLLRDIDSTYRRFHDLLVFADSGLLFAALGYHGSANEIAATELFALLRETGAHLNVFQPTIREMRRVLAVYEGRLGTHAGRMSLYPSELTRHFLSERATPSDIKMHASLLEKNIQALGVTIRELPDRTPKWTMDEALLGRMLADPDQQGNEPRVIHDVDCVAGVLMYRRGKTDLSIDRAGAVFATTSGLTVRNTRLWYEGEGGRGFAPIVHQRALSNYAWLKKPASASRLKVHELVALCGAALRPSRAGWAKFVDHLKKLEESGELSSDEATAIVASDLTDGVLLEVDPNEDRDAESLSEVVDRVKADYKEAADEREEQAYAAADASKAKAERLRTKAISNSQTIARCVSWTLATLLALALVIGTVLGIVAAARGESPSPIPLVLAVGPVAVVGLLGMLWGFEVKSWRQNVEDRVFSVVLGWMTGEEQ